MTTTTEIQLTSHPVFAAGGLEMMAKHLAFGIDTKIAHPTRLLEVAQDCVALLYDARCLIGETPQGHREIWARIAELRAVAEGRRG